MRRVFGPLRSSPAAPGSAPAYLAGMANFQLRALTGSFAPTGPATIEAAVAALPAPFPDWLDAGLEPSSGSIRSIITRWSGGIEDRTTRKLYINGGGHDDGAFNGVCVFDFSGATVPAGWSVEPGSLSTIANTPAGIPTEHITYNDGKAGSVHSYDGLAFDATSKRLYRFGGAYYSRGFFNQASWRWDTVSQQWVQLPSGGPTEVPITVMDQTSRKILVTFRNSTTARFFNAATESWGATVNLSAQPSTNSDPVLCYDPTRSRAVLVAQTGPRLYTINWSAETLTDTALSASGQTIALSRSAISVLYDSVRDSFWLFGGDDDSGFYNKCTEMSASTFACIEYPWTGDTVSFNETGANYVGSYKRAIMFEDWRAIGFCTSTSHPSYVLKLPA